MSAIEIAIEINFDWTAIKSKTQNSCEKSKSKSNDKNVSTVSETF